MCDTLLNLLHIASSSVVHGALIIIIACFIISVAAIIEVVTVHGGRAERTLRLYHLFSQAFQVFVED